MTDTKLEVHKLYKGKVKILFDRERHIFYHEDMTRIDGVTSATSKLDKSQQLIVWATREAARHVLEQTGLISKDYFECTSEERKEKWNRVMTQIKERKLAIDSIELASIVIDGMNKHRKKKREAADKGKEIHDWIDKWFILKKKPEMPEDEKVRNGVLAFLDWYGGAKIKIKNTERLVYSVEHDYAGWMDWDGEEEEVGLAVGDHKSSNGLHTEMRYQLSAYWHALEEELGIRVQKGYVVRFGKDDGKFEVLGITKKEHPKDFRAFVGLLNAKRREDELSRATA